MVKKNHSRIVVFFLFFVVSTILIVPSAAANNFSDVNLDEINRLTDDEFVSGFPDGKFHPNRSVTRAEAIAMIARTLDLNEEQRTTPFIDVPDSHYASGVIASAYETGLAVGVSAELFEPEAGLTRAQAAAFLTRAYDMESIQSRVSFRDVPKSHFAYDVIGELSSSGVTVGFTDGTFRPDENITRRDFAVLLARTIYPELRREYTPPRFQPNPNTIATAEVVNAPDGLNIRTGPGASYGVLEKLTNHTKVRVLDTVNNWAKLDYKDGVAYASLSYLQVKSTTDLAPLLGKTIVVDPGHGGTDPGAVANNLRESDVVLDISLVLQRKLQMAGANVVMIRETDVYPTITQRVNLANSSTAHAFVSVHANASIYESAHGTETFWNDNHHGAASQQLAAYVQRHLIDQLQTRDRRVKHGGFGVISHTIMPSILAEVGFITNRAEADRIRTFEFKEKSAEGIYKGLIEFFN
ncbi:N-acetylmuramoyl-L-alanine amidase [Bacillus shivajii]|uniref:N-acetylmuramoyl-L-alanine amidase n=1 Tax=Bacillus shivajii TaxID=1983719 RepID=UPI001CF9D13D|nr:N-acetylmuramoyl-L-alanine amidase [Bacillus shivajii]UCZ52841.1 N-acetylmuramoyl-L-alanine amidase [Bacillus shivajii]